MQDGWQVFSPVLDNGHQTDILISDGPNFHRLQVKTIDSSDEEAKIENRWKDSHVVFSRLSCLTSGWQLELSCALAAPIPASAAITLVTF